MYRTKSCKIDPNNIIVTSGSQEALYLISLTILDSKDVVIVERPTYLAMIQVLKSFYVDITDVDIDEHGIDTYKLEEILKSSNRKIKFLYTVSTCQNPTGITMSLDRRKHLLELAAKYNFYIVEDDPYSYYMYEETPDSIPLVRLDKSGRVIYCSTFSKILAPGFRIGWMVVPDELYQHVVKMKQIVNLQTTTLLQHALVRLLKKGIIDRRLPELATYYKKKRDAMLEALETYMLNIAKWTKPIGGMFIWVELNDEKIDTKKLIHKAVEEYKVAYVPGEAFYISKPKKNTMRLNFTYPSISDIFKGIENLSKLFRDVKY